MRRYHHAGKRIVGPTTWTAPSSWTAGLSGLMPWDALLRDGRPVCAVIGSYWLGAQCYPGGGLRPPSGAVSCGTGFRAVLGVLPRARFGNGCRASLNPSGG